MKTKKNTENQNKINKELKSMTLTDEQKKVVEYSVKEKPCFVTGGPGTGKTEMFDVISQKYEGSMLYAPFTKIARDEQRKRMDARMEDQILVINGEEVTTPGNNISYERVNNLNSHVIRQLGSSMSPKKPYESLTEYFNRSLETFISYEHKNLYDLVGIDELQDLTVLQYKAVMSIRKRSMGFLGAGDPNQMIYFYAGARGDFIFNELRSNGFEHIHLSENWRSGQEIVDMLNFLTFEGKVYNGFEPQEIIAKGPKVYGKDVIITRTNADLIPLIESLIKKGIPHKTYSRKLNDLLGSLDPFQLSDIERVKGSKSYTYRSGDNLTLMTGHSCKGLGFDRVFLFDWIPMVTDIRRIGDVEIRMSQSSAERNLLYVSCSRATSEFYLVNSEEGMVGYDLLQGYKHNSIETKDIYEILSKPLVL